MNIVLFEPDEVREGRVSLAPSDERALHLRKVLGVTPGATVRAGIVDGMAGLATVEELDEERLTLLLALTQPVARPPVDLWLALPRPKVLARLLSPIAQLGVDHLFLTGAYRVERFYFDTHVLEPATLRRELKEGLEQAKDTALPRVSVHRSFAHFVAKELAELTPPGASRWVFDLDAAARPVEELSLSLGTRAVVAIGPEGGYTDRERGMLREAGFHVASLGPRTLRSDVATIAALSAVGRAIERRR